MCSKRSIAFLCLVFVLYYPCACFAQLSQVVSSGSVYSPPSPDAAALLRYANVPVDEHTGIASVSLSIDKLSGRQLSIPITLSYHGSGNKVQDVASSVGLGFVLNTGGVITRVMRGLPDESTGGYQYNGKRIYSATIDSVYLNATINNKIDSEPDMFYFNFLGHAGKFVIDTLGNAQYLPDQGIRVISHPIHSNPDSVHNAWVLKDLNGTTYVFGADTSSQEITVVNTANQSISKAITYISSWYLAKVITPDGKETVNFRYSSGPNMTYEQYRKETTYTIHYDCTDKRKGLFSSKVTHSQTLSATNVNPIDIGTVINVLNAKYLSSIQNDMGSVAFSYTPRQDVSGGQSLNQIKVYNIDDSATPLKTYTFNESYFISPNSPNTPDSKRLRLDCISLQGRSAETKQLYTFTYNEQMQLPSRNSDSFDNWGYYTTLNNRAGFPPVNLSLENGNYDDGFDRRASDSVRMQACILTRIRNVNGGYTNFTYSIDDYLYNGVRNVGGGLRIKTIVENDSLGQVVPLVKQYVYTQDDGTSSGMVYNPKPYYIQGITNYQAGTVVPPLPSLLSVELSAIKNPFTDLGIVGEVVLDVFVAGTGPAGWIIDVGVTFLAPAAADAFQFFFHRTHHYQYDSPPFAISSAPLNNLFDINGASVTYSQVSVINADGGKMVDYYTSQQDYPDSSSSGVLNCLAQPVKIVYGNAGSYPPSTSFDFERGLLKQSKAYDNNNNLVSMVTNTYQLSKRVSIVSGVRASVSGYATLPAGFQVITYNEGIYKEISENIQLSQSVMQLFDQTNNGGAVTKTSIYTWHPTYPTLLRSESTPRSDGNLLVNYVAYPMDYASGTPFLDNMVSHYMMGIPIEKVSTLVRQTSNYQSPAGVSIIGGEVDHYKAGGLGLMDTVFSVAAANPIPLASFKFSNQVKGVMNGTNGIYNIDKSYIAKVFYQSYDSKNNLIQSQVFGEPSSSIIWGYNQDMPIAQVSNATVNQIAYTGFETNDQQYWLFTATGRDSSGLAKTGKIRYQLSAGAIKTKTTLPAGTYILSLWAQGSKPVISGTSADVSIVNGETDNHLWSFYMDRITVAAAGAQIVLTGSGFIDEVKLYPQGAHMSTTSIAPQLGILSTGSLDDKVNTYEYDALTRLATLRDDQYNVLKQYAYSNVPQVNCINIPDVWNGINPVCYSDQTATIPNVSNYTAVAANSYGNVVAAFTRTLAESGYLAQINYTVVFSDSTTYSNYALLKSGNLSTTIGIPLTGKSAESVSGIGIDTVINMNNDYGVGYQSFTNRQRVRDGYTEANTSSGGIGPYIPPIQNSSGCPTLFSNQAQTNFYRNNCSNGSGSVLLNYTVPAGTYTAASQFKADSTARAAGQVYANANGNCSAADTSFVGINPHCITGTADSGTPTLSAYTMAVNNIPQVSLLSATIVRTTAESAHDATVTYKIGFMDGSVATYTTLMYKNQLSINISPPLAGYTSVQVISVSVTSVVYSALNRLAYTSRQRLINGVADGYQEANNPGTYYLAPLPEPGACNIWFYNTAQTGFYRNNCSGGNLGALVSYTVPARKDSSMVSQSYADALSRSRGQAYANTYGGCTIGQAYVSTYAGSGTFGYVDGNAQTAQFRYPIDLIMDKAGNIYVSDNTGSMIRKITPAGVVSTLAGSTATGYADGTGAAAKFNQINGMAMDASGNIYASDFRNCVIRKITPQGVVTTFAGTANVIGHVDGQGTSAKFDLIDDITIDQNGNFYVMEGYEDSGMRIRKITPGGLVSTLAGTGTQGNVDGPYSTAQFGTWEDIASDQSGNIYKADFLLGANNSAYIRKLNGGIVSTFAGNMNFPISNNQLLDGTGTAATFAHNLGHLSTDALGNIYVADLQGQNVRKITPAGVVTTVAGHGATYSGPLNGPVSIAKFYGPFAVAVDAAGNIYVCDNGNSVIRKITIPH